jgi:hypothetical protein
MADGERHDPLEARVITVSREALRADLLDLELRITKVISEGLSRKADLSYVQSIDARAAILEREVVRRDGPDMLAARTTADKLEDVRSTLRERARWGNQLDRHEKELEQIKSELLSETELRALAREERSAGTTSQWTWFSRVASVVLLVVTLVSIWLAIRAQSTDAAPNSSMEVPVATVAFLA